LILSTTVQELLKNPARKFTYVEMKFFSMWWEEQTETTKTAVRALVRDKRLEFVNAGWSMHDEACTHYEDILNNMMVGHDFLMREFGIRPRIGWHLDPFGHSNANPRLFAEMGFDAWFFARLDFQDKQERLENREM
jgi:alpha-mannosidase